MYVSELIKELQEIIAAQGDLLVVVPYRTDSGDERGRVMDTTSLAYLAEDNNLRWDGLPTHPLVLVIES